LSVLYHEAVIEEQSKLGERPTHRRLADSEPFGRFRDAACAKEHVQHDEKIEINPG
jgi:hypothetical protein